MIECLQACADSRSPLPARTCLGDPYLSGNCLKHYTRALTNAYQHAPATKHLRCPFSQLRQCVCLLYIHTAADSLLSLLPYQPLDVRRVITRLPQTCVRVSPQPPLLPAHAPPPPPRAHAARANSISRSSTAARLRRKQVQAPPPSPSELAATRLYKRASAHAAQVRASGRARRTQLHAATCGAAPRRAPSKHTLQRKPTPPAAPRAHARQFVALPTIPDRSLPFHGPYPAAPFRQAPFRQVVGLPLPPPRALFNFCWPLLTMLPSCHTIVPTL